MHYLICYMRDRTPVIEIVSLDESGGIGIYENSQTISVSTNHGKFHSIYFNVVKVQRYDDATEAMEAAKKYLPNSSKEPNREG